MDNNNEVKVKIKKLDPNAVIPTYAHDGDVGMDLTAISVEYDEEKDMYVYHTGLAMETDKHYGILLFPRSSNRKTDAYLCNHVGIVDSAIYRGEIMLCFKNRDSIRTKATTDMLLKYLNENYDKAEYAKPKKSVQEIVNSAYHEFMWTTHHPMSFAPYKVGDRIAQMVVIPYPNVNTEIIEELSETERGDSGFGSTGN